MERIFNGIFLAAAMTVGVAVGLLMVARWPPGIPPDQTITLAAAVIAALGTWAVGFGAMHFAEAAHALRVSELKQAADAEFIRVRSHLISCQLTNVVYDRFEAKAGTTPLTLETRHTALRSMVSLLPTVPIGASLGLAEKHRAKSQAIDVSIAMIMVGVSQFMETYPVDRTLLTTNQQDNNFQHLIGQFRALGILAFELGAAEDALHGIKSSMLPKAE